MLQPRRQTTRVLLVLHLAALQLYGVTAASNAVVEQKKECAPGCTERGNCNAETGACECSWGRTGVACETDYLAVCRQTPDDPGSCGNIYPKHCECYRTCYNMYCHYGRDFQRCTHEAGGDIMSARCWVPKDPSAPRSSRLPQDFKNSTTWYTQFPEEEGPEAYAKQQQTPPEFVGHSNWRGGHTIHPLESCPNRCSNGRGVCFKWEWHHAPACLCHKGFNGTDCSSVDNYESCWFAPDCGGRGECKSGFCHCRPGYFGWGCHRTTAYQPADAATALSASVGAGATELPDARIKSRFKIYMYDLPWTVAFPWEYTDGHFGRDAMYTAYEYFIKYFLQDTATRTENPYEANLFFIPMLIYFYVGNVRNPVPHVEWVLDHVRKRFPFYDRYGGRDHFYFMTGDRGSCLLPRPAQDTSIKVVHFGMQRPNLEWLDIKNKEYACIKVKRDLVVPPLNMFVDVLPSDTVQYYTRLVANGGHDANRTLLFFFAGGVGEGTEYSGGVRQAIKRMLDQLHPMPADVRFVQGRTQDYRTLLRSSKFCIAPYGFGWGLRLVQAIEHGCIPLLIQDSVYQAFEDFVPYEEFSVRMPLSAVPHMVDLLRQYSEAQLAALRLGMAKYYRAFIWNREYGGTAYEWTLAGLQRRSQNMAAEYFRRRRRRDA